MDAPLPMSVGGFLFGLAIGTACVLAGINILRSADAVDPDEGPSQMFAYNYSRGGGLGLLLGGLAGIVWLIFRALSARI